MTDKPLLPEGVAPDNGGRKVAYEAREFAAPNVAAPQFAEDGPARQSAFAESAAVSERRDLMSREHQNITLLIAVVTLAMAIAGIMLLRSPKIETLPLCSNQPEWNQYNCRAD